MRRRPPDRRASWTQKVKIEGQTFYLNFGEYEDGTLCELFVDVAKQGSMIRGVVDALARLASIALQAGVATKELAYALRGCTFPPSGAVVGSPTVKECTSLADWIAQEIEAHYK